MTRPTYTWFHISNALVCITGLLYAWMRYVVQTEDPFAVVNHPWQPHMQHAHIIVAPLLVLMIGIFWQSHAYSQWATQIEEGRKSGIVIWVASLPMILSGYFIQAAVSDLWRNVWIAVHLVTCVIWIAGFVIHLVVHRLARS